MCIQYIVHVIALLLGIAQERKLKQCLEVEQSKLTFIILFVVSLIAGCSSTSQCRPWFPPATSPHSLPSATWESLRTCRHTLTWHTYTRAHARAHRSELSLHLHRYTLEQQIIAPSFSMQQVNCNAVLVPSPVFTSPIMIPHNSFITNQSHSAYHTQQPQASQHSLQLQQPQQFFQVRWNVCCSDAPRC